MNARGESELSDRRKTEDEKWEKQAVTRDSSDFFPPRKLLIRFLTTIHFDKLLRKASG